MFYIQTYLLDKQSVAHLFFLLVIGMKFLLVIVFPFYSKDSLLIVYPVIIMLRMILIVLKKKNRNNV